MSYVNLRTGEVLDDGQVHRLQTLKYGRTPLVRRTGKKIQVKHDKEANALVELVYVLFMLAACMSILFI